MALLAGLKATFLLGLDARLGIAVATPAKGGRSVLSSVLSVIDEIRFLENGNRSVPKKI